MSWRRIVLATLFVVAVAAASSVYALTTPKRYDATARVVVQTILPGDTTFTGIDVLRATGDTSRDLGTAAHFFDTPEVVSATATRLSLTPAKLGRSLDVHPLAGSNVLLIVGKASSPEPAAQIANGIVQEAIAQRTARVQAQVSAILNKLSRLSSTEARRRAIDLQALQNRPDPTLETLSAAKAPTSAAWPRPARTIGEATVAALLLAALFLLVSSLVASMRGRAVPAPVPDTGLDDREEALARRARAIDQRERELQQVVQDAQTAIDATSRDGAVLDQRVAAVTTRERALARQSAELAQRERDLAAHEAAFEQLVADSHKVEDEPEPVPEPVPVPEPEAVPEPEPEPAGAQADLVADSHKVESMEPVTLPRPGGWTIQALERLLAERGDAFPDQVDGWSYYIQFLGDHADTDGALPSSFDYLIEETFADLLEPLPDR